jgi:hypothetical protein
MRLLVVDSSPQSVRLPWATRVAPEDALSLCTDPARVGESLSPAPQLVIVPLTRDTAADVVPLVSTLRRLVPGVPVVAWCAADPLLGQVVPKIARAGVEHFAFEEVDALADVVRAVARTQAPNGTVLAREAIAALPPLASRLLEMSVFAERPVSTVSALGAAVGLSERTLLRRCAARGWPCPRTILRYAALIRGLLVLEQTGDIEAASHAAGYRSPRVFRTRVRSASSTPPALPAVETLRALLLVVRQLFVGVIGMAPSAQPERPSERAWREKGLEHRLQPAGGAELERPQPGVPLRQITKRAG